MTRVAVRVVIAVVAMMMIPPVAAAEKKPMLRLDQEAPKSAYAHRTIAVPEVQPGQVVADNLRAVGVMVAMTTYERAGLFSAGERIVADLEAGKISLDPASARAVLRLAEVARTAPSAVERAELVAFVSDQVKGVFASIVADSIEQMSAYGELLGSVTESLDEFVNDDVREPSARDQLAKLTLVLSHAGYGAVHYAAAQLSRHAHELTHVVQQSGVQKAYGAKDAADLVAKLGGQPRSEVEREMERGELGAKLIVWLAEAGPDAATLKAKAKADDVPSLIERLRQLGAHHPRTLKKNAKVRRPTPHCLPPGARKPVPCKRLERTQKPPAPSSIPSPKSHGRGT
jgi:hypothetical protein